jgi:hypothetical protein
MRRALRSRAVGGQIIGQSLGATCIATLFFFDLTDNKTVHDFNGKQLANISTCAPTRRWNCSGTNKDEIDAFERTHFSLVGHCEGWKIPEAIFSACRGYGRIGIAVLI